MRIPNIEQKPRTASDTAIHYGYCAFRPIALGGLGRHNVQPPESPYYHELPAKTLIPFTNVVHREIDEKNTKAGPRGQNIAWIEFNKSAKECVYEMADSYAKEGFVVVEPLTGYTVEDAADIFETIHPFAYKLKDLADQIEFEAIDRINQYEPYEVSYEGETITLQPLRDELKSVAEEVRAIIAKSVDVAYNYAADKVENTRLSMTRAFAGGDGKRRPDPLDRFMFEELGEAIPTLISSEKETKADSNDALKVLAQALSQKDDEAIERIKNKEAELDSKLAQLDAFLQAQANKDKMAAVRAAKPKAN